MYICFKFWFNFMMYMISKFFLEKILNFNIDFGKVRLENLDLNYRCNKCDNV